MTATEYPQSRSVGHALAGQALLGLGRAGEAKERLAAAQKELETVPVATIGLDPTRGMVKPWVEALRGEMLLRAGRKDEGRAVLKEVVKGLRATFGPDAWSQALVRMESMARMARDAGDWELAEFLAAQMLDHDAAYGGSHLAQAHVLARKGDEAGAARAMEAAKRFWRDADPDLAELTRVAVESAGKRP